MTASTQQIEEKFNKALPSIDQSNGLNDPNVKPRKFDSAQFLKAAQELQKVIKENDKRESSKA